MNPNVLSAPQQRRRYIEDCVVVYFDTFISDANLSQLSQLGCSIESSIDPTEYTASIVNPKRKKLFCVISERLGESNIELLNNLPLVKTIFVISATEANMNFLTSKYPKVKGIYSDIMRISEAVQRDIELIDRNSTPITIFSPDPSSEQLNTLDPMFMYYQLLKETYLEMNYDDQAKQSLVDFCKSEYADNQIGMRIIDEFDRDYTHRSATWWYTRDCFVYRMLNKALRTHDIEVVNKFAFYIKDLHYQLQELHSTLPSSKFTIYRGQRLVHVYSIKDPFIELKTVAMILQNI